LLVAAAAGSLIATGIWALLDTQVAAGLFYFPNNETDALLHFGTATIFLVGAGHYLLVESGRRGRALSAARGPARS
jgi:hypothetical protein